MVGNVQSGRPTDKRTSLSCLLGFSPHLREYLRPWERGPRKERPSSYPLQSPENIPLPLEWGLESQPRNRKLGDELSDPLEQENLWL